jgi:uncharacterized protein YuzE
MEEMGVLQMIIKYDKELDVLTIRDEKHVIKSSLRIGPNIFDFSFNGKVVGIEIMNVSGTMGKILNLKEDAFMNIENARIRNIIKPDVLMVVLTIVIRKKEYTSVLNIPLKTKIEAAEI